ncbi:MAG: aldo/keto reductase family protein [Planctomycetota bacterium]
MQYRRLGASGLRVGAISLGTWLNFGGALHDRAAQGLVRKAFDLGINLIDTADVYGRGRAESQLGAVLEGTPRQDYVLASKVFFPTGPGPNERGLSRKHIFETVHASLERLRTPYVDLFQCHRYDEETPVEETVRAFDDLIRQGKILYWGVSMWTALQVQEAIDAASEFHAVPPVSNQPPYSLLNREIEAEVMPTCRRLGIGILPYSPLAQGVLTGKYLKGARPKGSRAVDERRNQFMGRYLEEEPLRKVERMVELAGAAGLPPSQLALAWVLDHEEVSSVIVGAMTAVQLAENAAAAEIDLDPELRRELDDLFTT